MEGERGGGRRESQEKCKERRVTLWKERKSEGGRIREQIIKSYSKGICSR